MILVKFVFLLFFDNVSCHFMVSFVNGKLNRTIPQTGYFKAFGFFSSIKITTTSTKVCLENSTLEVLSGLHTS